MKKVALVITIALLSGCATIPTEDLAKMDTSDLCAVWDNRQNNYDAYNADLEIQKRRKNGDKINCMTASPDLNVCVTSLHPQAAPGSRAMSYEEIQRRQLDCSKPEILGYMNQQQQIAIQRQQNALGLMAIGNAYLQQSQQYRNPPPQKSFNCTSTKTGVFTNTTCN